MAKSRIQVSIKPSLYDALCKRAHPGQSLNGVIYELLSLAAQIEGKPDSLTEPSQRKATLDIAEQIEGMPKDKENV